jgi:hypothetical protein
MKQEHWLTYSKRSSSDNNRSSRISSPSSGNSTYIFGATPSSNEDWERNSFRWSQSPGDPVNQGRLGLTPGIAEMSLEDSNENGDADVPRPSIEQDITSRAQPSQSNTTTVPPSLSPIPSISFNFSVDNLRSNRAPTSSSTVHSNGSVSSGSNPVNTPSTTDAETSSRRGSHALMGDSVADGVGALRLQSQSLVQTPSPSVRHRSSESTSPSPSPYASGTPSSIAFSRESSLHPDVERAATPRVRSTSRRRSSSAATFPVHRVEDEVPPPEPFHNPEFQNAFREAKQLMNDLSNTLASSNLYSEPNSTLGTFFERLNVLRHFECPKRRTVGLVGDSGVGKSSLLNSLLDCKGLARSVSC